MNKTADIEEFVTTTVSDGPITQDELVRQFRRISSEQLTWLGIAVHKMEADGRITFPNCEPGHSHEGDCVLNKGRRP